MKREHPPAGEAGRQATKPRGSRGKIAPGLVALSSAAILSVYAAGYTRTQSAAERFAGDHPRSRSASPDDVRLAPRPAVAESPARASNAAGAPGRAAPPVPPARRDRGDGPRRGRRFDPSDPSLTASTPQPTELRELPPVAVAPVAPAQPVVEVPLTAEEVPQPLPRLAVPVAASASYKDGTYVGLGACRHGEIEATVIVEGGQVTSARISQCWTRYSCSWVAALPAQVIARQSAEVDYVSGATESADAFHYAVQYALAKAK